MAVVATVLRNTHQETIVKVAGTAATAPIDISAAIIAPGQALTSGGTPKVSIVGYVVSTLAGATVTVTRNGVNVITVPGGVNDVVRFNENGFMDNIQEDQNIDVTIAGAEAQIYLILRKTAGYSTKIEPATFGAYDDETAVGS